MIDKSQTILLALVIISITSITLTMIVSQPEVPKEIEPIEKIPEVIVQSQVPKLSEIFEESEIYMINQSLKGFNSIKGEALVFTISYFTMADVTCCEQNSFNAFFSFFNEETGEYVDLPLEETFVTEGGLLVGTIPSINTDFMILDKEVNEKLKVIHFTGVGRKINADYLL